MFVYSVYITDQVILLCNISYCVPIHAKFLFSFQFCGTFHNESMKT